MASEVLYSGLGDVRLTQVLSRELQLVLADRFSLWGHPSMHYAGNAAQSGSTTIKVPIVSLNGVDRMAAVAENASTTNTAFTDTSVTVAIARQALQRQISDLANITDSVGINTQAFIDDMIGAASMRFMELLVNLTDDFSSTAGSTGVDLDVDDWFTSQFTLTQASVPGPYLAILYPVQLTDLQNSIRGEAGALQFKPSTGDMLNIKAQGLAGNLGGIDIVASSLVPTANAGADSAGGMFGFGAITFADGSPAPVRGAGEVMFDAGTKVYVELERDAGGALTKIVGNYFVGLAELEDARGVSIITDR